MFYVQRDAEDELVRLESTPFAEHNATLSSDSPEAQAWFAKKNLQQSDLDMIRVLDDLVQVLMDKGVLRITDLPPAAQSKLLSRTQARVALGGLNRLIDDDEVGVI